jgi:hypothetical protein
MITVFYRITTGIIVLELLAGGIADLMHANWAAQVTEHLGYPLYIMSILGFWKVLGALAIALPETGRLKEWAYAGTVFELTGALGSHIFAHDPVGAFVAPTVFTGIALISWELWERQILERRRESLPAVS